MFVGWKAMSISQFISLARKGLSIFWEVIVINELVQLIISNTVRIFFYKRTGMKVGKNTYIFRKCYLQKLSGISVGNNCVIGFSCKFNGKGPLTIGNNVNISSETIIESGSHDFVTFESLFKPITIKDNVWIGTRAMVLQGVTIGEGAVVAAGSVVTRDVQPFTIVAGVPARVIGTRPNKIDYQLKFQPWFY
jgi:acetyltransferase-like isoleucine patch superfamily enzyme